MKKLTVVFALALIGCGELTAPATAVPIDPIPQAYRVWWAELEACSGLRGDVDAVRFFAVEQIPGHPERIGQATISGAATVILLTPMARDLEWAVKHEMMHGLIRTGGHPVRYFRDLCGNLLPG